MAVKFIKDFEDYLIYDDGRIYSLKTNKFLKFNKSSNHYYSVELFNKNGSKRKLVHRLVALAFLPNPNNYPQVNHKDENPLNNNVDNLEWCTAKYNMNYGVGAITRHTKIDYSKEIFKITARKNGSVRSKKVLQFTKDNIFITAYKSIKDASRQTHVDNRHIASVCHGKRKSAGNYIWKFEGGV